MKISTQLNAGIRYLDARVKYVDGDLQLTHGIVDLWRTLGEMASTVNTFLTAHPTEFVLMRISKENTSASDQQVQDAITRSLRPLGSRLWSSGNGAVRNPAAGELRGKLVVLDDVAGVTRGIRYRSLDINDNYQMGTNWDLYDHWVKLKSRLTAVGSRPAAAATIPFTSMVGSGGSFPYFVASGKSSPGTHDPQLLTGLTTPGWKDSYPDFPRYSCFIGICSIAFMGLNQLSGDYIASHPSSSTGIIASDFPGPGLINAIIAKNPVRARLSVNAGLVELSLPTTTYEGTRVILWAGSKYIGEIDHGRAYYNKTVETRKDEKVIAFNVPGGAAIVQAAFAPGSAGRLPPIADCTIFATVAVANSSSTGVAHVGWDGSVVSSSPISSWKAFKKLGWDRVDALMPGDSSHFYAFNGDQVAHVGWDGSVVSSGPISSWKAFKKLGWDRVDALMPGDSSHFYAFQTEHRD